MTYRIVKRIFVGANCFANKYNYHILETSVNSENMANFINLLTAMHRLAEDCKLSHTFVH